MRKYRGYRGKRREFSKNCMLYAGLCLFVLAAAFYLFFPGAKFLGAFFSLLGIAGIAYFLLGCVSQSSSLWHYAYIAQKVMTVLFVLWLLSFFVIQLFITSDAHTSPDADGADYLIVLGAGLNGRSPSLILASRLNEAADYLNRNPECIAVVTGGLGSDAQITEAEAMYSYLVSRGIDGARIVQETEATSTIENIRLSFDIIDSRSAASAIAPKVAVLSNDFHLFRAELIAAKEHRPVSLVSAETPLAYLKFTYYIREYFSLLKVFFVYK